jgi:putative Ca2+/H+ antiporter (TMEM165/GDT1 family)
MDPKLFVAVFGTVFLAELGDKTQLATLLYAADAPAARVTVFVAAASAPVVAAALGVLAGGVISAWVSPRVLRWAAGAGFVAIGL